MTTMSDAKFVGRRFGRLMACSVEKRNGRTHVHCQCDCGNLKTIRADHLASGAVVSCGCYWQERRGKANITHGHTRDYGYSPEYGTWQSMRARCGNPHYFQYHYYGGRGISVCDRWQNSFEAFLEDMGPKPTPKHSIDRIDPNGNYEPGNCRWATSLQQQETKRQKPARSVSA